MSAVITSPAQVVNLALSRIGYKKRIGNLYEGSEASKKALDIYAQTRDQLLRDGNWQFARRDAQLVLLKQAPAGGYVTTPWSTAYPPPPWRYEYTYPSDCLKVRNIKAQQIFANFLPRAVNFSVYNDSAYSPARKVILCDVGPTAIATYAAQVTNPASWEATFVEALAAELGKLLAPALDTLDAAKMAAVDAAVTNAKAAEENQG